jgi:phosphoribosyl 1,2-cyclic phosphodiesterase
MKVTVWGCRGSVAAPGVENARYGGNTSCVQVQLEDGTTLVLDAGTGIRGLGLALGLPDAPPLIHILLTHLHLDHIQGLMFFAPCFRPQAQIVIWGPAAPEASLEERIGRYISAPLSPVEVRELPCDVSFRDAPAAEWEIGSARIRSEAVTHRGPTLGYRVTEGERSLCYIPDHEPGLGAPLAELEPSWISGFELAHRSSLLIHDCQYTDEEYPAHVGWGHSRLSDALAFARRTEAERVLLFHHDPMHDDPVLDAIGEQARARWHDLGGQAERLEMATEKQQLTLDGAPALAPAGG